MKILSDFCSKYTPFRAEILLLFNSFQKPLINIFELKIIRFGFHAHLSFSEMFETKLLPVMFLGEHFI